MSMRKLRKRRMLRQKKTPVSRFLPLPFRASYPLGWICSLPFRASYPSPLRSDVRRRVSFALPTPSGRALSRFLPPGLKFFRASYPLLSDRRPYFRSFLVILPVHKNPFRASYPLPGGAARSFLVIFVAHCLKSPFALPTPSLMALAFRNWSRTWVFPEIISSAKAVDGYKVHLTSRIFDRPFVRS